ncbi:3-dehydroquinate synthase II family protein [Paractinoplanes lichenicola]|uniref:3-dehydroquinate synthase II family protein n=1 Tax=Paractinoplanes lichenicola TaxID=2802976 RepID=A0ABS1VY71_9ACTN|nr:3-dehydroquinate synthase II family protein [Actinoplanes lichenicola]MBL7259405.1 3-dehydroquinate synthase II family protein [Actinoplanes lichenicola]
MTAKLCWLDLRAAGDTKRAVTEEAIHQRFDAVVAGDPADLAGLPPTVTRVLVAGGNRLPDDLGPADLVLVAPGTPVDTERFAGVRFGERHDVTDRASLDRACEAVRGDGVTLLSFADPTNIPMEIVLAAAARTAGTIITEAGGVDDAVVHLSVLEHGPDGVLLTAPRPGDATRLAGLVRAPSPKLDLVTLTVTGIRHVGAGERACVDTCTYLRPDEGILVGSWAKALMLCVSETHPLPYMPTRPFRVNAGAIMSYTLADGEHTRYLSELSAGDTVLAVGADGRTRKVTVGRVKIETRPLLAIDATAPDGEPVNLIVQDDWHVRVLGPGAAVLNTTELKPGDEILGHLPGRERHVGYPIDELCYER